MMQAVCTPISRALVFGYKTETLKIKLLFNIIIKCSVRVLRGLHFH